MNDNNSSPMKKRKANDGRSTADGTHDVNTGNTNDGGGILSSWFGYFSGQRDGASSSGPSPIENNTSQLDRMEVIMMRMEEKLATVESRCETLEAHCSSLENILESTSRSTKEHIDEKYNSLYLRLEQKCSSLENRLGTKVDSVHEKVERSLKFHEYNEMLIKNQSWEYSADVDTTDELIDSGYTEDDAEFIAENAQDLKFNTTKMRTGEFPYERYRNEKGVHIDMHDYYTQDRYAVNNMLLPHWKEFAAALKHFTPAINLLSDEYESYFHFHFDNVQLGHNAMLLIKKALIGKPFRTLSFTNNDNGEDAPTGMSVDAILDIVESSKHVRELDIGRNRIGRDHIERLCSAVHTRAIVELNLSNCFEPGIGDEMLTCLLTIDELKLENLYMCSNNITSGVSTVLADFLATNPRMKELHLEHNRLNDSDAALIANALRSNTTLGSLQLYGNSFTDVGAESLRLALYDESSLNATADSNHTCTVYIKIWGAIDDHNSHEQGKISRGWKIYSILCTRNETMSNVQHFGNIDVKLLPNVLDVVQKYATNVYDSEVNPLSIVYEIMRKWDKAMTCWNSKT